MTLFKLSPSVLPAFITETICGIFKNSPPAIIVILKMLQNICNPYDRVILIITLINCGLNKYYIIYVTNGQSSLFFALRFSPSFDFFAFESLVDMMIGSEGSGKVNKDYIAANIP
jgi:hypothetical protein